MNFINKTDEEKIIILKEEIERLKYDGEFYNSWAISIVTSIIAIFGVTVTVVLTGIISNNDVIKSALRPIITGLLIYALLGWLIWFFCYHRKYNNIDNKIIKYYDQIKELRGYKDGSSARSLRTRYSK
nr:hypothetical protein [Nanoarchaeum sp.]